MTQFPRFFSFFASFVGPTTTRPLLINPSVVRACEVGLHHQYHSTHLSRKFSTCLCRGRKNFKIFSRFFSAARPCCVQARLVVRCARMTSGSVSPAGILCPVPLSRTDPSRIRENLPPTLHSCIAMVHVYCTAQAYPEIKKVNAENEAATAFYTVQLRSCNSYQDRISIIIPSPTHTVVDCLRIF